MEMKLILSLVLSRVHLELAEGARVNRSFVLALSPRPGLPMRVERKGGRGPRAVRVDGDVREMVDLPP
jgi:hypothetical protein